MPPVGFEPTISAGKRLQTYALDRAATEIGGLSSVIFRRFLPNLKQATTFSLLSLAVNWTEEGKY